MKSAGLFEQSASAAWSPPQDFPELPDVLAIDVETRDPLLKVRGPGWCFSGDGPERQGYVVGYVVACAEWSRYYPVRHEAGGNFDPGIVETWLREELAERPRRLYFANAAYDLGWMQAHGIVPHRGCTIRDVLFAGALEDENQEVDLDHLLRKHLGESKDIRHLQEITGLKDPRPVLWRLPARSVGVYAEQDGGGTLRLGHFMDRLIDKEGLGRVYDVECALVRKLLLPMRARGIPVDLARAVEVGRMLEAKEKEALDFVYAQTGIRLPPGVPTAAAVPVMRHLGLSLPQTAQGRDSVTKGYLEGLDHPVAQAITDARKYRKAKADFIDSAILGKEFRSRIFPSFHPLRDGEHGTVSGRFSASDPNIQQVPARDPIIGPAVRSVYVPEEGKLWCKCDYASQEPRWTLHFAAKINARGAHAACEKFRQNPSLSYHNMTAELTGLPKPAAKAIFLGLAYGMGQAKLCRELGLPTEQWAPNPANPADTVEVAGAEGKRILEQFHREVPFLKELTRKAKERAESTGFVRTYLGRKCLVRNIPHKALNRIIQGSAADQGKLAALAVADQLGEIPYALVHDEGDYGVENAVRAQEIAMVMEECIPDLLVPFVVEPVVAANWGACKG